MSSTGTEIVIRGNAADAFLNVLMAQFTSFIEGKGIDSPPTPQGKGEKLYTFDEAIKEWGVSKPTGIKYIKKYKIERLRGISGRKKLIKEDDVMKVKKLRE